MKSLLVSGTSGYLGRFIVKNFSIPGFDIYLIKRSIKNKKFKLDILKLNSSQEIFNLEDIKEIENPVIIHCAASTQINSNLQAIFRNNINLSLEMIELIKKLNRPKLINISSQDAYGQSIKDIVNMEEINKSLISESILNEKFSSYGASKLSAEYIFDYYSGVLNFSNVSLRLPAIVGYGCHKKPSTFISKVASKLLINEPLVLFNKDALFNNLIHIKNLLGIIEYLISDSVNLKLFPNTLNISSKKPLYLAEVIRLMKNYLRSKSIVEYKDKLAPSKIIDTNLAQSLNIPLLTTKESILLLIESINQDSLSNNFY